MPLYRLTLCLTAPLGTAVQGPTLFGQICWLRREAEGEAALKAWLSDPQTIWRLSDGFPAGFLPRPLARPRPLAPAQLERVKEMKKRKYVSRQAFLRLRDAWDEGQLRDEDTAPEPDCHRQITRNHVDRRGQGTIEEGGLFRVSEDWRFADERTRDLDLYVETAETLDRVRDLVAELGRQGYGRGASLGRGLWQVAEAAEETALADHPGPRRLSLSRGVLDPATMRAALWRAEPQAGRLGPQLSLAGVAPFKRPVLLTRPGATFEADGPGPFGRLLHEVHPDRPEVVVNALHLALPFQEAA
ncbi:hypothetical protein [Tabrizicola sp. YIM 78059]|uniref:type III-A CRISPR-associated RAMP protein Csm4 n=1 Tax=Tabrizicola sp. YIM 78059 TaxID=2529861 RepID=UPI0010A995C1|nr:hypothetical protein [Tabrizicola sp. YIM 78059]